MSASGNDKVWRKLTFSPITTTKVRVLVQAALDGSSRVTEVEAWGPTGAGGGGGASVNWLVSDHLGTPRMVMDESGALAGVSRHDYLPFGEEIGASVGGRTIAQGYEGDDVRQKFTGHERDAETELDFMRARYYAKAQGRFTSTDSYQGNVFNPQTLNLYAYVQNRPLNFTDPTGHMSEERQSRLCAKGTSGCGQSQDQSRKPRDAVYIDDAVTPDGKPFPICRGWDCKPTTDMGSVTVVAVADAVEAEMGIPGNSIRPIVRDNPLGGPAAFGKNGADYILYSVSVPVGPFGLTQSGSVDRWGQTYGGVGLSLGKTWPFGLSTGVMYGLVERSSMSSGFHGPDDLITPAELEEHMTGYSADMQASGFFAFGYQFNSSAVSYMEGESLPGAGIGQSYGFKIRDLGRPKK